MLVVAMDRIVMRRVEPIKIARTIDLIDVAFVPIFAQFF